MQPSGTILAITTALLLRVVGAQQDTDPGFSLTFTATGAQECGTLNNDGNRFNMTVQNVPRSKVCFTFREMLHSNSGSVTEDTRTEYLDPMEPCPADNPNCGINFTLSGLRDASPDILYQQIFYRQSAANPTNTSDGLGRLALTTYAGFRCMAETPEIGPWYAWTCASEEGECAEAETPINSFTIGPVQEEWRNNGSCFIAAKEGKGLALGVPMGLLLPVAVLSAMAMTLMG